MDTNNRQPENPPDTVTQVLSIRGQVQGVGFRWSMCAEASALGLSGWVRNRHDGSVEALVHGPADAVAALVDWAHRGPTGASVVALEVQLLATPPQPANPAIFEQRPTA
ncbi:MAG: acylphosphatase [Rhodocyclaceae bacterium]|jgi:acylphosphatase